MIVFLTGAGISSLSGLPTYRGPGGLYENGKTIDGMPIEEFLTKENRLINPEKVQSYIDSMHANLLAAKPNELHYAVAEVQKQFGFNKVKIITQNIDILHEKAGAQEVIHLHGTSKNPVLFGENISIDAMNVLFEIADKCRYLVIVGSSIQFDYLIGFIGEAKAWGAELILLDTDTNHRLSSYCNYHITNSSKFETIIKDFLDVTD